jgi:hypothetical protein
MAAQHIPVPDPIAIVSIGMQFSPLKKEENDRYQQGFACLAASVTHPAYGSFSRSKKYAHMKFIEPQFSANGFDCLENRRLRNAVASYGFLQAEDPFLFDHAFFGITDTEVEKLDAA